MNKFKLVQLIIFLSFSFSLIAQNNVQFDTLYAVTAYNKAISFHSTGNYDSATFYLQQVSSLFFNLTTDSKIPQNWANMKYLDCQNRLSFILAQNQSSNKAKNISEFVIKYSINTFGKDNIYEADAYRNLGLLYYYNKDYVKSYKYYLKALSINEKISGKDSPPVRHICFYIGDMFIESENIDSAAQYYSRAISITEKYFGNNQPEIAFAYNRLAWLCEKNEREDLALDYYFKTAKIFEVIFKEENLKLANTYTSIGFLLDSKGEYDLALEYFFKSNKINKDLLGEEHSDVSFLYMSIGNIYSIKENYDLALEYFQKALRIDIKINNENHTHIASLYNVIGDTYYDLANYSEAITNYQEVLDIQKAIYGKNDSIVAQVKFQIGTSYYKKGEFDLAAINLLDALRIYQTNYNEFKSKIVFIYRNIGNVYFSKGEYKLALDYLQKALTIDIELYGDKNSDVAKDFNNLGLIYYTYGEYDLALNNFQKALNIIKELYGETHPDLAIYYSNIGIILGEAKGEYNLAIDYHNKALKIIKEYYGENHSMTATSYDNFGRNYCLRSEYDLALDYYLKATDIRRITLGEKHPDMVSSLFNIGSIYLQKNENEKAFEYFNKALILSNVVFGEIHRKTAAIYGSLANVSRNIGKYTDAIEYNKKALNINIKLFGENHPDVGITYTTLGTTYLDYNKFDSALLYFQKALSVFKESFGNKHPHIAVINYLIGFIYQQQDELELALKYYHFGLLANLKEFNDSINVDSIPRINNFFNSTILLNCLHGKAQVYNRLNKKEKILSYYKLCDTLIIRMRKYASQLSDKMTNAEQESEIYNDAIQFCFNAIVDSKSTLNRLDLFSIAFDFSEKNKARILLDALSGQESLKFAGIPDSLLHKEHELKVDLSFYEKKLAESPDSIDGVDYRNQLFKFNRQYEELIARFEKDYPDYYNLKYSSKNLSLKDIQSILDNKTVIRSYFVGDSSIYIFTLTNSNFDIQEVNKIVNLNDSITWFRYGLTKTSQRMQENYRRIGFLLYKQLFPEDAPIDSQIENLIIIPDDILAIIPFESLLTNNYTGDVDDYKNYPYLIKKYNISYSYSANLFYQTFSKQKSPSIEITKLKDWLAYAPVFDNSGNKPLVMSTRELQKQLNWLKTDSLMTNRSMFDRNYITPLPATETETEDIFKLYKDNNLNAKVLLYQNANEQSIKAGELQEYKVLHFATHGFVNSERPELSGLLLAQDTSGDEDGVLYSGEIYNLKLNADLVVLSACETGLGKIQKGEGIIGLTRALLYAGAKSIIVSLWQVADESTADLMVDFYKNSLESKRLISFSEALRNAKLRMISEGRFAYPLFWSPFILIGK